MKDEYVRKQDVINLPQSIERNLSGEIMERSIDVKDIETIEPADVVPVRHARWIKPTGMMPPEHHGHYECSECGAWAGRDWLRPWRYILLTDFCPGCGAKMDGEE